MGDFVHEEKLVYCKVSCTNFIGCRGPMVQVLSLVLSTFIVFAIKKIGARRAPEILV